MSRVHSGREGEVMVVTDAGREGEVMAAMFQITKDEANLVILAAATDREYLESRGWKLIGTKKTKYGHCECWDHPTADDEEHTARGWWTKGDALSFQRMQDKAGVKPEPIVGRVSV